MATDLLKALTCFRFTLTFDAGIELGSSRASASASERSSSVKFERQRSLVHNMDAHASVTTLCAAERQRRYCEPGFSCIALFHILSKINGDKSKSR